MKTPVLYKKNDNFLLVEAMKLEEDNIDEIANWSQSQIVTERNAIHNDESFEALNVRTLSGKRRCSRGMYVVKQASNFHVVGGARFESLYSRVP